MVNYADKELFNQDSLPKNLIITYDNVTLTNSDIVSESFELTETLCPDENITLGSCNASQVKFRIGYIAESLIGKTITVSIQPQGGAVLQIGVYKVATDTRTSDRRYKDIVAYDAMYDILNADVMSWYNTLFPNVTTTKTMKQFRDSFFSHFGITQEPVTLINDTMTVRRTIDAEKLSGKDVITAICEANGCFGHIGRDGKFKYIYLAQLIEALYPSEDLYPSETLYPSDGSGVTTVGENGTYISVDYEDYSTAQITKLQIRQEEDDIGVIVGSGTNSYIIEGNFLFFGMEVSPLTTAANNILTKLGLIAYRPSNIEAVGNPCFEVGDGVQLITRYDTIITYIMQRTLKGIQALKDNYVSTGTETRSEDVNSAHSQVMALSGRMNKLTRTIDETTSELTRYETATDGTLTSYNTRISQNAEAITSEATRASTAEGTLSTRITQTADAITSEATRASTAEGNLSTRITQNADAITSEATRASTAEGSLYSRISQTADAISAEVTRATGAEGTLSASIEVNAQAITQKVSKGAVSSEISQEAGQVSISANRLVVDSSYFELDSNGTGTLGGLAFDANGFYSIVNGTKVLRVYPNPSSGFALSVGENVYRIIGSSTVSDQAHFSIGHEGEVYVTKLYVLDEVNTGGTAVQETGQLYVDDYIRVNHGNIYARSTQLASGKKGGQIFADDYIECLYNIESKKGSIYARAVSGSTSAGNVVAERYLFSTDGQVHTSDKRLKKNIKPLTDSEEFIYSLKPVEYQFRKDKDGKKHHGLIAQELQKVNKDEEWNVTPLMPDGKHYGICYEELIADLIKTVQSQNERIKELEERLERLEEKINAESVQ